MFLYIKDSCDHAGFWKVDAVQIMDDTGLDSVDIKAFIEACNRDFDPFTGEAIMRQRVRLIKGNILWLTGFVQFQYEAKDTQEVNPNGNFAKGAIGVLEAYGLLNEAIEKGYLTLSNPIDTLSNPKEGLDRVRGRGRGKDSKKEEEKKLDEQVEAVYQAYPRKVGKKAAQKKIRKALEEDVEFDELIKAVKLFADSVSGKEKKFIPYPATWFNQGRWEDDPEEWAATSESADAGTSGGVIDGGTW